MAVIVFGSINMDLVVVVPRLPSKGETTIGDRFFTAFGGKGANQAVAVAKLGIPAYFVGRVGGDDFGEKLLLGLKIAGVNADAVKIETNTHSGVASIVVDERGQNTIACAAGANGYIDREDVERFISSLKFAKLVILELGIPLPAVIAAAQAARKENVSVILDPAPATPNLPAELYPLIDIITPNEVEASQLVGFSVCDRASAQQAASILHERGVSKVIITLGSQGSICCTTEETFFVSAIGVKVVDTVAAGDGFNGGLAAALVSGKSLKEAVQWATAAGALTVTQTGAQSSLPNRETLMKMLEK